MRRYSQLYITKWIKKIGANDMKEMMHHIENAMIKSRLKFSQKPILVGGMAMEYYGIRKAGADIDLIITDEDYQKLAEQYPEKRKDLYGDLGLVIDEFEIWRSIAHLDYDFFCKDTISEGCISVISIDRLLWTRVCAMDVEKYHKDLVLMKEYYYQHYTNRQYHEQAALHENSYKKMNGAVFGGKYED